MLIPVIGLEIHIQLKTKSKMFCGCSAHEEAAAPNTHICPVCTGQPGVLPVPNEQAVRWAVLMGLALNATIASASKFDRKNYFYPDLPKAYQISQYDIPIARKGFLELEFPAGNSRPHARIGITRVHLEEDAAKNLHQKDGKTLVDFNRAGTPLMEIVTEPDFISPMEAKRFLQELRQIARYLGVSDADMEKGHLRCDANVSLREEEGTFHPKIEIKNLNSFKHVERALEYEILRQRKLWEEGHPPDVSTTRGWNDAKQMTVEQRTKENEGDYRYFPEPDIPPLELTKIADEMRAKLPELPAARRARFVAEYGVRMEDARVMCEDPVLADFVERTFSELSAWLEATPENEDLGKKKMAKLVSGWTLSKLLGLMGERAIDIRIAKVTPENFAEFLTLIADNKLSSAAGLEVLGMMLESGADPTHIMEEKQLGRMHDAGAIAEVVDRVIANHPQEAERYRAGEAQLLQFFIGMVMKETEGTADPGIAKNMLKVKLG